MGMIQMTTVMLMTVAKIMDVGIGTTQRVTEATTTRIVPRSGRSWARSRSPFPKHGADNKSWINSVFQSATGAARDEGEYFPWVARVAEEDCAFDELGNAGNERSLDSKLRAALVKHTTGDYREKHRERNRRSLLRPGPGNQVHIWILPVASLSAATVSAACRARWLFYGIRPSWDRKATLSQLTQVSTILPFPNR